MTPQDQLVLHDAEAGQQGDCMRAVLSSLLDIDINTVPNFAQLSSGPVKFYGLIDLFLEKYGYELLAYNTPDRMLREGLDVYHCISGVSPRDSTLFHAVVGLNGKVYFDPHPSRAGLAGDPKTWIHSFLYPLYPDRG